MWGQNTYTINSIIDSKIESGSLLSILPVDFIKDDYGIKYAHSIYLRKAKLETKSDAAGGWTGD